MNLNPEQHRLELKEAMARNEAAQSVNIMYELERQFNRVFAGSGEAKLSDGLAKGGNQIRESASSHKHNHSCE